MHAFVLVLSVAAAPGFMTTAVPQSMIAEANREGTPGLISAESENAPSTPHDESVPRMGLRRAGDVLCRNTRTRYIGGLSLYSLMVLTIK
jgi:hypothetical protein